MTKTLKNALLFICVFAFMLTCVFSVSNIVKANADEGESQTEIISLFETKVSSLDVIGKTNDEIKEMLANTTWANTYIDAKEAYILIVDKSAIDGTQASAWEIATTAVGKTVELYENTSTLFNDVKGNKIRGSKKDLYYSYLEQYNALSEAEKSFINERIGATDGDVIQKAVSRVDEILSKATEAVQAIADIYKDANGDIVLNSEASINTAKSKLLAVYGVAIEDIIASGENLSSYIANYSDYTTAVEDLQAQKDRASEVVAKITTLKGKVNADTCYSLKDTFVKDARDSYDALGDAADNNLKALVSNYTDLTDIESRISNIKNAIDAVIEDINEIGTVVYTDASLAKIVNAETTFAALDKDVKDAEDTYVTNYQTLVDARAKYDEMDAKVEELIEKVLGFKDAYANGTLETALSEYLAALNDANVTDEQKDVVRNTETTDGNEAYANINEMYQYYVGLNNEAKAAANIVKNLIENLGSVTIEPEWVKKLNAARAEYDKLTVQAQAYVTNYQDLLDAEAEYAAQMSVVNNWVNAVNAIDSNVTVENWDKVDAAETEWNNLTSEVKVVIEADASRADILSKYNTAIADRNTIKGAIEALLDLIDNFDTTVYPSIDDSAALDAFTNAVNSASNAFNNLDDTASAVGTKEYFKTTYATEYEFLSAGLEMNVVISVEAVISHIPAVIAITDADVIRTARDAYDAMTARQDEVRNYANLESAESDLAELAEKLETWMSNVSALRNNVELADLWSLDLVAYQALVEEFNDFTVDEQAYVVDGKTELDQIKAKSDSRIEELNNRIAALGSTLTSTTEVEAIKADYDKLHATQQEFVNYDAFISSYNKVVFVDYFDSAVQEIANEVALGNFVLEDKIMLDVLKSIYASASVELQGLVKNASLLDETIEAYKDKDVLDLVSVKVDLEGQIAELKSELENAIADAVEALEGKIAQLKSELESKIAELKAELETTISNVKAELESKIAELKAEVDANKAEIEKELSDTKAELEASIEQLKNELNKKDTIIIIVFAVLSAVLAGGVIALFVIRKKN